MYIIAKCDDSIMDLLLVNGKYEVWDEAVEALLDIVSSFNGYESADEWKSDPENDPSEVSWAQVHRYVYALRSRGRKHHSERSFRSVQIAILGKKYCLF